MIIKATPSLTIPFNCTKDGITKCHGKCCTNLRSYWPIRVYQPDLCPYLSDVGCKLSARDRPIDCLLYPLFINGNGTLVVHNHAYHKTWVCRDNCRNGPPLVDALGEYLTELFGVVEYQKIKRCVAAGKSYVFRTTPEFTYCRMVEDFSIKYDLPIIPRSQTAADFKERGVMLLQMMEENIKSNQIPVSKHYRVM